MAGRFFNLAKRDSQRFITQQGFEENIVLQTPDGNTTLQTTGWNTKHWIKFVTDGLDVNAKNAHICLSETDLTSKGYPVRNSEQEVFLRNHRVDVVDSSGVSKLYVINEWFPNETLGLIVCILGDFNGNAIVIP